MLLIRVQTPAGVLRVREALALALIRKWKTMALAFIMIHGRLDMNSRFHPQSMTFGSPFG